MPRPPRLLLAIATVAGAFAAVTMAPLAAAQTSPPPVWCVPGTPLCARGVGQGNGNGGAGVTVGGSATGQVGPRGAQGQAQGNANGNANANASGNANTNANAGTNANANANGNGQGGAQGGGSATGSGQSGGHAESNVDDGEPEGRPVHYRHHSAGPPLALGQNLCLVGRVGVWSGYHGGLCYGFGLRSYEGVGFELELVVLAGGTVPTLDILFRPTLVIPLAGTTPYFDQLSLKIGSTVVGGSIPLRGETSYLRFGGSVGLGYDLALSDGVDWRVLDASVYGEVRVGASRGAYMDRLGNDWDLGLMVSTGFFFH